MKKLQDYETKNPTEHLMVITGGGNGDKFEYKVNVDDSIFENDHDQMSDLVDSFVESIVVPNFGSVLYHQFNIIKPSRDPEKLLNDELNDMINKSIVKNLLNTQEKEPTPLVKINGTSTNDMEEGVVIQLGYKFWGVEYDDGNNRSYGWVGLDKSTIYDPTFLKKPQYVVHTNSIHLNELMDATLVKVVKKINIEINLEY